MYNTHSTHRRLQPKTDLSPGVDLEPPSGHLSIVTVVTSSDLLFISYYLLFIYLSY